MQSWVWLIGRLWIILQEQNPAHFGQMFKQTGKEAKNTIFDSIIQHHQKQWSLRQQSICLLFKNIIYNNVKLSIYVRDEDSIPAAQIKEKVPYPVEKWTDTVYPKGSLTTTWNICKFINSLTKSYQLIIGQNVLLIACLKIREIHQPFKNP